MRLDHLLSKENLQSGMALYSVLRSDVMVSELSLTLFNLEGARSKRDGGIAQLGERLPCKQEVSGSIPLISTKRANSSAG